MLDLKKISYEYGKIPPEKEAAIFFSNCCSDHKSAGPSLTEIALSSKPHPNKKMQKVMKELFADFAEAVTETEIKLLRIFGLPNIDTVRRAAIDNQTTNSGKFELTDAMVGASFGVVKKWMEKLLGKEYAKKDADEMPIFPTKATEAYNVGGEIVGNDIMEALPEEIRTVISAGIYPDPEDRYFKGMVRDGATRLKANLSLKYKGLIKEVLLRGAENGDWPIDIAVNLHSVIGEGNLWWWLRVARSECQLANNAAFDSMAEAYKVQYEKWSCAPNACPICYYLNGRVWKVREGPSPVSSTHPHCATRNTKVLTSKGFKNIQSIEIGDLVLTHSGHYNPVTFLHKHTEPSARMVTIKYRLDQYQKNKGAYFESLKLTHNHPVLVNGEWQDIGKSKIGDKIKVLAKECANCGKLIPFYKFHRMHFRESVYCSSSCRMFGIQKKFGSEYLLEKFRVNSRELVKEGKHHFQVRREEIVSRANSQNSRIKYNTRAEQVLNEHLLKSGIEFVRQFIVERPEKRRCSINGMMNRFYKIDFVIPKLKIGIEVNGKQWKRDVQYDEERKTFLEQSGFTILEYDNETVMSNPACVVNELKNIMMNHSGEYKFMDVEIIEVKEEIAKDIELFNLSVTEDESYLIQNFVVHNCLCARVPLYQSAGKIEKPWTRNPYENPYSREELEKLRQEVTVI